MDQIPERALYPRRAKFVFLLLVCLLFTLGGIQAASAGEQWGHLAYLIFGLPSAVCVDNEKADKLLEIGGQQI